MLSVYWFCFVIGGSFVFLAVLGGLDGPDYDINFDSGFYTSIDGDIELTDTEERSHASLQAQTPRKLNPWQFLAGILKSLKFWTFGLCFFGLTGLVLSRLALSSTMVAIAAASMGTLCGALVAGVLQALRRRRVDSLVRSPDLIGLTGTVELPFDASSRGKVQVLVKGTLVNFTAYTDESKPLRQGEQVLVVGTEQNRLWVVSADSLDKLPDVHTERPPE
jgi:membrane protein implicated in regulation of membrane protease activity